MENQPLGSHVGLDAGPLEVADVLWRSLLCEKQTLNRPPLPDKTGTQRQPVVMPDIRPGALHSVARRGCVVSWLEQGGEDQLSSDA